MLTQLQDIRAFHKDQRFHSRPPNFGFGHPFAEILGSCIGVTHGEQWQRLHAFFQPGFSPSAAKRHYGTIITHMCRWVESLAGEKQIDVFTSFSRVPFGVIASVLYGRYDATATQVSTDGREGS